MIFTFIGISIILYSLFNFKKGFSLYLCYKLILVTNITLISKPGLPLLTLEMAMTLIYAFLFFLYGRRYQFAHIKFPFALPFGLYAGALIISSIFSIAGLGAELSNIVKQLLENIIIIWMAWQTFETKDDFFFIFKIITLIIFFSCVYGIVEYCIKRNPLTEYEATLNSNADKLIDWTYSATSGRGYRINSIFEHAMGAGVNWSIYSVFVFALIQKKTLKGSQMVMPLITAILCIPCILLTNSRSPVLFFIISVLSVINFRSKKFLPSICILLAGIIIIVPFLPEQVSTLLKSFFSSETANSLGGSSIAMRFDQFGAAFELMSMAPLFGLGPGFHDVMNNELVRRLLGSESIWLQVMPQLGLVGLMVYIFQVVYFIFIIPKRFKSRQLFFIALAYWVTYTITSLPGFESILFYLFIFYFIKTSSRYKRSAKERKVYGVYFKGFKMHYNIIKRELKRTKES